LSKLARGMSVHPKFHRNERHDPATPRQLAVGNLFFEHCVAGLRDPTPHMDRPPSRAIERDTGWARVLNIGCKNIRLSAATANPLSKSRN
jgi:hypothetical protein